MQFYCFKKETNDKTSVTKSLIFFMGTEWNENYRCSSHKKESRNFYFNGIYFDKSYDFVMRLSSKKRNLDILRKALNVWRLRDTFFIDLKPFSRFLKFFCLKLKETFAEFHTKKSHRIWNVPKRRRQVFISIKMIPLYLNFVVKFDKLSIYDFRLTLFFSLRSTVEAVEPCNETVIKWRDEKNVNWKRQVACDDSKHTNPIKKFTFHVARVSSDFEMFKQKTIGNRNLRNLLLKFNLDSSSHQWWWSKKKKNSIDDDEIKSFNNFFHNTLRDSFHATH